MREWERKGAKGGKKGIVFVMYSTGIYKHMYCKKVLLKKIEIK